MLFLYIWLPWEVALKLPRFFGAETFMEIIIELYLSRCLYIWKFFPTFFAQERTLDTFTFWNFWLIELSTSQTCDFWVIFVAVLCSTSSSKIVHSTHLQVLLSCIFYQVCDCAALNLKFEINNLTKTITSSFDV